MWNEYKKKYTMIFKLAAIIEMKIKKEKKYLLFFKKKKQNKAKNYVNKYF